MRENRIEPKRAGWGAVAVRATLGLAGGLVNALAIFATLGGVIVYAVRQQEDESEYAAVIHVGYVAVNGLALYFLLKTLGDEERRVLPVVAVWAIVTATVIFFYWNWVLG
jgi:FtsH-binding integral membrane protein